MMNFKFLHAADIHLDSPLRGLIKYEGMPVDKIRLATRVALENMVQFAIEQKVDFVLLAGDIYDGDWKDYNTGRFFALQMGKLQNNNIKVFIINGNHDATSKISKKIPLKDNVTIFKDNKAHTITLDDLQIAIHGQSFSKPAITDNLAKNYPEKIANYFNIGMLHTALTGAEGHERYAPCNISDLHNKEYDYWALGHVHKRQVMSEQPSYVVFPGCLQGRHIKEQAQEGKGATLVNVVDGNIETVKHQALDVVRWQEINISAHNMGDIDTLYKAIRQQIESAISSIGEILLVVRIIITGASELDTELRQKYDEFYQEVLYILDDSDNERVCLEKLKIKTTQIAFNDAITNDLSILIDNVLNDDNTWLDELKTNIEKFKLSVQKNQADPDSFLCKIHNKQDINNELKQELIALLKGVS